MAGTYGIGREAIGAHQAHGPTGFLAAELTDRTAATTTNRLQHGCRMAALMAQTVPRFGAHTLTIAINPDLVTSILQYEYF